MIRKTIAITGGGQGIGKATAQLFAIDHDVVILDWNEQSGLETAEGINSAGGVALFLKTDVGVAEEVERGFARVIERFGRLDILFANAAVQINKSLEDTTDADWDRMMATNLRGTFLCCRAVAPIMRKQGAGCIVICSSEHAFSSYPRYSGYAASKGGLLAFMRATAIDLGPYGIRVNGLIPGATEGTLLRRYFSENPEEEQRLLAKTPLGRLATP